MFADRDMISVSTYCKNNVFFAMFADRDHTHVYMHKRIHICIHTTKKGLVQEIPGVAV